MKAAFISSARACGKPDRATRDPRYSLTKNAVKMRGRGEDSAAASWCLELEWRIFARRGCLEGAVSLRSKEVLAGVAARHRDPRRAGLTPERVDVRARHEVLERAAQFRQFDHAGFVGDLLQVQDQVAVVVLLGLRDAGRDWRSLSSTCSLTLPLHASVPRYVPKWRRPRVGAWARCNSPIAGNSHNGARPPGLGLHGSAPSTSPYCLWHRDRRNELGIS